MKRVAILAGIAFLIFFVVNQPAASADLVKNALSGVGTAADKLALFVKSLTV
ncbi:MAG TPA: hypothetical protein VLJ59_09225 [Mycobacteriales bacterium]|nr:hypothetical protein [Mycobacteriales bacterium]